MKLVNAVDDSKIRTIAVDFDGTLCEKLPFPQIGQPKMQLIQWLKEQQSQGVKIILWTCREGDTLAEAICWCKGLGLVFDAVNQNVASCGLTTRKVLADLYIDDRACIPTYN